jgi:hypothetical protein
MTDQENKMINNWEVFLGLVNEKLPKSYSIPLAKLCEDNAERLITAPGSSNAKYVGAFPGGLVWHGTNVLRNMKNLRKSYELDGATIPVQDMVLTALFHDVGKVGTEDEDYYVPAKSKWHADNGFVFQINPSLASVSVPTLSLWWLNKYNVPLTLDVVAAINSLGNMSQMYSQDLYEVSPMTLVLQQAVRAACVLNKDAQKL